VSIRKLSAECSPPESEVIAEVPLATPTVQAEQDLWMRLVTQVYIFQTGVRRRQYEVGSTKQFVTQFPTIKL
jgi:hypothetical protein